MATIESYETAGGKRYQVRYRTPQRTQTKKRGLQDEARRPGVRDHGRGREDDRQLRGAVARDDHRCASWPQRGCPARNPTWPRRNYRTLEVAWRIHVQPVWGSIRIADVDLGGGGAWIAAMKRKSGATTVIRAYGVLAGILDDAVKGSPAAQPIRRAVSRTCRARRRKRRVYLTPDDVGRLAGESGRASRVGVDAGVLRDPVG